MPQVAVSEESEADRGGPAAVEPYRPAAVERKWQERWRELDAFTTPEPTPGRRDVFVLVAPPFTSGEAHMGHVRSYSIGDAYARFRRARGDAVLFSLGFDAFGLPAELGAMERGIDPHQWVSQCSARMRSQFDRLGFSFDWSRTFLTNTPDMYQWSQWLFVTLLDAGLIVQRDGQVDWCDSCRTALSRQQVIDGRCWRCDGTVRLAKQQHWHLRLSVYNEENDRRLAKVAEGWNEAAVAAQRALLGRTDGVEFEASVIGGEPIVVFTPYPDAVAAGEFVALSPRHPELHRWLTDEKAQEEVGKLAERFNRIEERRVAELPTVDTGLRVQIDGVEGMLPVVVSPAVDIRFGPTAVLGVPTMDRSDAAIAEGVPKPPAGRWRAAKRPLLKRAAVRYRAADFPVSRQRAWGAPVPIVHCEGCGPVPVPAEDLPVRLPEGMDWSGPGNALVEDQGFRECSCPRCGEDAQRDTDTLDCHVDAFWIYFAVAIPSEGRGAGLFEHPELRRWLPIAQFVQGADTGGFVLDERMIAKALRDLGVMEFLEEGEPIERALMHDMVKLDGRKMSKHLGNVVNPQELVEDMGADTLRFSMLYAAAPSKGFTWDTAVLEHCRRFLDDLWAFAMPRLQAHRPAPDAGIETSTAMRRRLASWCETATGKVTRNLEDLDMHRATRNVMALLERIVDFESRVLRRRETLTERDREAVAASLGLLLRLLAPLAPHFAEEVWSRAGNELPLCQSPWPEVGEPG